MLIEKNPETVAHTKLDSNNRFLYFFLAFAMNIRGFRDYMRSVICVDGSLCESEYKETLLVVVSCCSAGCKIEDISYCLEDCRQKTNTSWDWFFTKLKDVVDDSERLI